MLAAKQIELDALSWMTGECSSLMQLTCTVWPENLAGIKFGGLALKGCELHLAD